MIWNHSQGYSFKNNISDRIFVELEQSISRSIDWLIIRCHKHLILWWFFFIILFSRVPLGSEKFRSDIKVWLTGCVGILIRASTFFDELFLLNHLLRCPSSVLTWASCFLQISLPSTFSGKNCHNPYVKHLMTMLQCVLQPTKARDDFLSAFSINQSFDDSRDGDSTWIVLDPDVEEDGTGGMKLTTTMEVQENDVFYLLKQFPFDRLFSCLCGSDCVDLEPFVHVTEYDVLGLFSFCHEFLELLVEGLWFSSSCSAFLNLILWTLEMKFFSSVKSIDRSIDWLMIHWRIVQSIDWLIGWFIVWLAGWLFDLVVLLCHFHFPNNCSKKSFISFSSRIVYFEMPLLIFMIIHFHWSCSCFCFQRKLHLTCSYAFS